MTDILTQAAEFTSQFEGFSATVYKDSAGKDTIGYGTLLEFQPNIVAPISQEDAKKYLAQDLQEAYQCIKDVVTADLTDNQTIALIDFIYNEGRHAFEGSTLLKLLNQNYYSATVAAEFLKWDIAGGLVSGGLLRRRRAEHDLFLS